MWTPRVLLAAFLFLALSVPIQSQKNSTPEEVVSKIVNFGFIDGHYSKIIGGIGDAGAVAVTKIVSGRSLNSDQIDRVLIVLNMAFAGVMPGPDAEPKTALFVLRDLELSTNDPQLRGRIEQSRKYAEEEFSKSKKPMS